MRVKIRTFTNGEGVIIPKSVRRRLGWRANDRLDVRVLDNAVVLEELETVLSRQTKSARIVMDKYRDAFAALAKT